MMNTTPLRSSNSVSAPCSKLATSSPSDSTKRDLSPIASAPRNGFKLPAGFGALNVRIKADPEETPEIPETPILSWTSSLLSPVLKLFSNGDSLLSSTSSDDSTDTGSESKCSVDDSIESKIEDTDEETLEDEDEDQNDQTSSYEFDPFVFMAHLPPHHLVRHNVPEPKCLPRIFAQDKPTLVLDLDETLVHCTADVTSSYDINFDVQFNGLSCQVFVRKRPHLEIFLEAVSSKFEVVVFTASQRVYAERLLDRIDPQRKYVHHRLYRESCLMVDGNLLKDLSMLGRDLRRTIIVDNSPHAFGYQLDNGVPIVSWYDDPHDVELLKLMPLLDELHQADDVRPLLRRHFRVNDLVSRARNRYF